MKHLTVGVFQDDTIARELGKKDTESDIAMFHRKVEEQIFTFIYPVEDKLSAKSQIVSCVDAAIVAFAERSRELGETIVMLDSLGISNGIAVTSLYATPDQIANITMDTALESFIVGKRDVVKMLEVLKSYQPERDTAGPALVQVDHSFSVKGVGEVILGFVKKGVVRKYDKLNLQPADKGVMVRSIQIQDEDREEAEAGSRVGLAIKGATIEEMKRGSILSASNNISTDTNLMLSFRKSPFYSDEVRAGAFHITVGMQTVPVTVSKKTDTLILIESEKPIVHLPSDTFLLLDLNARKSRVVGSGHAQPNK